MTDIYSRRFLFGYVLFAIFFRIVNGPTANLSFLVIAVFALLGRQQAIQALALSWLFTMINPTLAAEATNGAVGRYLVIIAAGISVAFRNFNQSKNLHITTFNLTTLFMGIFILLHSLLFSAVLEISILKVTSWVIVVFTLLSAWGGLTNSQRMALFGQLVTGLVWLIVLSIPLLALPSIGFARNGTGFQGLLNHPQSFGPTVALLGALVGGRVMQATRPAWLDIVLLGLCFVLIFLSEARTAGLAMVLGLMGTVFLSPE